MRTLILTAAILAAAPAAAVEVPGHYPTALNSTITTSDPTATAAEIATFLGAPDDSYTGLGSHWVTYDLGVFRVFDGPGQDFNVYEVDFGAVEFSLADILVSADGITFFNVESTAAAAVDLIGDNAHGNPSFRRSYDLGGAVIALGASQFRYIRIDGTSSGPINGSAGFDLEPSAW
jgi:hypothetical protein